MTCGAGQQVTALDLSGLGLAGTLPLALLQGLPALQALNLSGNSFSGPLPAAWASRALQSADLSGNDLSGALPAEWLAGAFAQPLVLGLRPGNPRLCGACVLGAWRDAAGRGAGLDAAAAAWPGLAGAAGTSLTCPLCTAAAPAGLVPPVAPQVYAPGAAPAAGSSLGTTLLVSQGLACRARPALHLAPLPLLLALLGRGCA